MAYTSALLDLNNLSVYYYDHNKKINIIEDLSLRISPSEVFGLVGESGCGKTMTALSILRLLPRGMNAEGRIVLNTSEGYKDLLRLSQQQLTALRGSQIGMIFQEPMTSLNPVLTIGEQVSEPLVYHLGMAKKEAIRRSIELLRMVKIPEPQKVIKYYPHQLSGGMRQRVMIAIAISCNPRLLIADEPTTALDVTTQAEILDLLLELQQTTGMSILLITHDLAVVAETSDRVAVMYAGRVVELAPVKELFTSPLHPYTIGLLQSLPIHRGKRLNPVAGTVPSAENMPSGCKFSTRCMYATDECRASEPVLKEYNTDHYVRCFLAGQLKRYALDT